MKKILLLILLISVTCAAKIRVISIDTGIDKSHEEINLHLPKNPINILDYQDYHGHGTHIAGLILNNTCPEVELESCSWFSIVNPNGDYKDYINCLRNAILEKPDFINISSGGPNYDQEEFNLLTILSNMGVKIIVAAGNNGKDLSKTTNYYPAKYKIKNLIPVGNLYSNGERNITSNYGLENEVWEPGTEINSTLPYNKYGRMTGTSQATAKYTNKLLLQKCNEK